MEKKKIINIGIAVLSFIFLFLDWIKVKSEIWGYSSSTSVKIFEEDMFDVSFFLGLGKILAILSIIAFVAYIASMFIDLKKLVPALEKKDLDKLLPKLYFVLYVLALICALIGLFTADDYDYIKYSPAIGWWFGAVSVALGFVSIFKPELIENVTGKVELKK